MPSKPVKNNEIADLLNRIADLLDAKGENPFRVRSYRTAADSVASVRQSLANLVQEEGAKGLSGLKGVGEKLAGLIQEYVEKGKVELLEELEKEVPAEKLETIKKRKADHKFTQPIEIPVALILEIDEEYRKEAAAGNLKMIAPRLLNPEKEAWLPLMNSVYKGYKFTVMFSNTATAHKLGKTDDWVVVYFQKEKGENQCTVVTESRGPLKGKRVVRGKEKECQAHYSV
ncbi:MAG: helix-hairpin-helix domain-containing protein [Bacteroidota bacterium]